MTRPTANLRLFAAVYPPPDAVARWLAALQTLALPPHRRTPSEQIHLTIQFIGDTPAKALDATLESVARSAAGLPCFELTAERLISLPARGPVRLIAAETDGPPTLLELQRRLATRLATRPRGDPGRRFRPHLTLCRFRRPERMDAVAAPLEPRPFAVDSVALMRSTLHPDGARHHELESFALQPLRA